MIKVLLKLYGFRRRKRQIIYQRKQAIIVLHIYNLCVSSVMRLVIWRTQIDFFGMFHSFFFWTHAVFVNNILIYSLTRLLTKHHKRPGKQKINLRFPWHILLIDYSEWVNEWVSDYCLTPTPQFSAISWREQVIFQWDDDEVRFILDQHAKLDFHSASSLKQQCADRHVAPLGHIILIPSQPVRTVTA
jgi:hypothetical protein